MRAIVARRSGGPEVLELAEVSTARPRKGEVLVRVRAAGVNASDRLIRSSRLLIAGLRLLRGAAIAGLELAGVVDELGEGAARFIPGDEVYGALPSTLNGGAYAEWACLREGWLARKPVRLSFIEAAGLPVGGVTALQLLRDVAQVEAGQRVLVNGASGAVGGLAVQLARARGCEVIGVASARNGALVRELGANRALDYAEDDVGAAGPVEVILDAAGTLSLASVRRLLAPRGIYMSTTPTPGSFAKVLRLRRSGLRGHIAMVRPRAKDLEELAALADAGKLRVVVDRVFPLAEAAAAQAYLAGAHPTGRVVLDVS